MFKCDEGINNRNFVSHISQTHKEDKNTPYMRPSMPHMRKNINVIPMLYQECSINVLRILY